MSLFLAPGRVRRCHQCRGPLEQDPDTSRDQGFTVWICSTCADEGAGVEPEDADEGDYVEGAVFDSDLPGLWELADFTGGLDEVLP